MANIDIKGHDWEDRPPRDGRPLRTCKRCRIDDYRIGTRGRVQWPCIVPQETWSLEETKTALLASGMKLVYIEMLTVKKQGGKHYAGLLVPDTGRYGLSLHPAKSTGTLQPGKALALFFNWAMISGFDLDTDPVLHARLSSKTGD